MKFLNNLMCIWMLIKKYLEIHFTNKLRCFQVSLCCRDKLGRGKEARTLCKERFVSLFNACYTG